VKKTLTASRSLLLIGIPAMLLACGGYSSSTGNSAVGNYTAITFVTTRSGGSPTNEILAGSTLLLNLKADGTTSGHLHIAGSGGGLDADMAGTWTQYGTTVDISQSADTFVKDMVFTLTANSAGGWDLTGDQVFTSSSTRIQITLRRS
jgi:hypothetical protein